MPWSAAAARILVHDAYCVVASGGSSSSIFVHTKSKIRLATSPDRMPKITPIGLYKSVMRDGLYPFILFAKR